MKRFFWPLLIVSHLGIGFIGFALGIYALPILIAPKSPDNLEMMQKITHTEFIGEFQRDLQDSDFLHWGEGKLRVGDGFIAFEGELAPGPDYKLYLSPQFVETEADFNRLKSDMVQVGDVQTFDRFILPLQQNISLDNYNTAIVWCETFGQFISAAQFKP
ncbi:DM13 domain-containing protein [Bacterioplanoides sp.]|uniref:DM13 domain-containing protein n=1 Tax=Bacterioplanoides sp. TaxID=2066072 RepID=UPI003B5A1F49